jgi:hypothetical protein
MALSSTQELGEKCSLLQHVSVSSVDTSSAIFCPGSWFRTSQFPTFVFRRWAARFRLAVTGCLTAIVYCCSASSIIYVHLHRKAV